MTFLPFLKRFHAPIRARRKRYTLRAKKYGEVGDVIESSVGPVRITSLEQRTPAWVRDRLYAEEGCSSPEDFEAVWRGIHRGSFEAEKPYWLHGFEPVEGFSIIMCRRGARPREEDVIKRDLRRQAQEARDAKE